GKEGERDLPQTVAEALACWSGTRSDDTVRLAQKPAVTTERRQERNLLGARRDCHRPDRGRVAAELACARLRRRRKHDSQPERRGKLREPIAEMDRHLIRSDLQRAHNRSVELGRRDIVRVADDEDREIVAGEKCIGRLVAILIVLVERGAVAAGGHADQGGANRRENQLFVKSHILASRSRADRSNLPFMIRRRAASGSRPPRTVVRSASGGWQSRGG